ncbi:MAG TPA: hypothetical protein VNN09_05060 [Candidatus Competibacteraceae bacterium]|nr:hypothetical protein [Candidatus Competibacteraceae bacterium]
MIRSLLFAALAISSLAQAQMAPDLEGINAQIPAAGSGIQRLVDMDRRLKQLEEENKKLREIIELQEQKISILEKQVAEKNGQ